MVIWVAVGGRGTLLGAVVGAVVVNAAQSAVSESFPDVWQYGIGALFIATVLVFPRGLLGGLESVVQRLRPAQPRAAGVRETKPAVEVEVGV